MLLNTNQMAFGRNETFFLKYNWTHKALDAIEKNKDFLTKSDSFLDLGVGKNMLSSIRYWLGAYRILDVENQDFYDDIARSIFHPEKGLDPYLEREETLWLMHWRLCSNPINATLYYWFFNRFKNSHFEKEELLLTLNNWLQNTTSKKFSPNTIERDVNLLLKTYSISSQNEDGMEEALENPFTALELVFKNSDGSYNSEFRHRESVGYKLLTFVIIELLNEMKGSDLLNKREVKLIPLAELIDSSEYPSIKNIFRLSENCIIKLVEDMAIEYGKFFELSETAGQRNLILKGNQLSPNDLIKDLYK